MKENKKTTTAKEKKKELEEETQKEELKIPCIKDVIYTYLKKQVQISDLKCSL